MQVVPKLTGTSTAKTAGAALKMQLQKAGRGRRLSATCDSVPILLTACASSLAELHATMLHLDAPTVPQL